MEKLIRFIRLHLGFGNEGVGNKEVYKSWIEVLMVLLRYEPVDEIEARRAPTVSVSENAHRSGP